MKKTFVIFSLLCVLCMSGCDHTIYHWDIGQESSQIKGFYIVEASSPYEYDIIQEIPMEKWDELIEDIESIPYTKYGWNLWDTHGVCFVIEFQNGDYDIISYKEPMHFVYSEGVKTGEISWLECDMEEFSALIDTYRED